MNAFRFLRKCLTDPPAAWASMKLVLRGNYSSIVWKAWPNHNIVTRVPGGGRISLNRQHVFTHHVYPAVENYETDVVGVFKQLVKPGMTVVDCGANIGFFSAVAAGLMKRRGHLLSIEANPVTFEMLKANMELNHFGQAVHCALTRSAGMVKIFMPAGGDVFSSLRTGGYVDNEGARSFDVPGRTLDDVIAESGLGKVDFAKIDIEGAELEVLRSCPALMEHARPIFVVEYNPITWQQFNATWDALTELLAERRYTISTFDPGTGQFLPTEKDPAGYANLVLSPIPK